MCREAEGGSPDARTRFMHRYMDYIVRLSTCDADVRLTLLEAFNMLTPPTAFFRPGVVLKVLKLATGLVVCPREDEGFRVQP